MVFESSKKMSGVRKSPRLCYESLSFIDKSNTFKSKHTYESTSKDPPTVQKDISKDRMNFRD